MWLLRQAFRAGRKRRRALIALLVALLASGAMAMERPRAGLLWNRSGLPLVFPLILKTAPGEDFFVALTSVGADTPAMAAYARGGDFFRVLVPPGTYDLSFAAGTGWQGEELLFGPGDATRRFDLDDPLTFQVRGIGTKAGHVVDLTGAAPGVLAENAIDVQPVALCQEQRLRWPEGAGDNDIPFADRPRRYARGDGPISANRAEGPISEQRDEDGPLGAEITGLRGDRTGQGVGMYPDGVDIYTRVCG